MNRILLVEDEKAIASMTKMCLTKNGYICDWAMDGQTAAGMMEEKHYDLMLLDVMLPDMEGYELMTYSKQFSIPVIFVTAKTSVPDKVKGLRMGGRRLYGQTIRFARTASPRGNGIAAFP